MARYSIGSSGVDIASGRGKSKSTVTIDFSELDAWAQKMKVDTKKLMEKSFANACSGLKKKFTSVVQHGGGECGVSKFKDFEEFTNELRQVQGISNRPMGGKLAEKSSVGAWKKNGWQTIGWKDYLRDTAISFQDGLANKADTILNNDSYRHYLHTKGIHDIPRTYSSNPRQVIPEPFGDYVKEHLEAWAKGSFYKSLAKMMQNAKS